MTERPARGHRFAITDRRLDLATGSAVFEYELDGDAFAERIELGVPRVDADPATVDLLLDLCHVLIGTSYYKLSCPARIEVRRVVAPEVTAAAAQAYDEGLRELCVVNDLPIPLPFELDVRVGRGPSPRGALSADRPLAPLGGGKDSAAVLTLMPGATGLSVSTTPIQRQMAAAAGIELLEVGRTLDPTMLERSPEGFNGHIPITAINSALAGLAAHLHGFDSVVMGNERSASEPTRWVGGYAVNHQHSKSLGSEVVLHAALARCGLSYFSLLRPLSEVAIAGIVTESGALLPHFLSCNRAFRRSRAADEPQTWCLECPKCLFTFLVFAPWMSTDQAVEVFGGNPLDDPSRTEGFRDLWHPERKPFDCVGERAESAAAMTRLATDPGWAATVVVKELSDDAEAMRADLGVEFPDLLDASAATLAPDALAARVVAAVDGLGRRHR